ncbi:unnamed protein product (macronuclear) [Paramecium tetraurelia]|uniref:Uncharacterized protein n=1 Tax=Paramecium tetraurelia TaxID=5888 RepID=A0DUF4_PARTE|nr:uncharacterized protein GSPATT00020343001 [Paramecium tetraurelia]CAK86671.1 unnamed protein product [Paramecium tetraurelia]|eukprot:XP_001454068.1 hypothetical protein (macronuclear) [Paramecium tetraurelia strain d4-2]
MKYLLVIVLVFVITAKEFSYMETDCLPATDLNGQKHDPTYAEQARKHLTKYAEQSTEDMRKYSDRQPYPNLNTYSEQNCAGSGADLPKRDRRFRRAG